MGTSLSGLTPATTFDGLLKTSDNEPLDGTLKAISTGDGTDTILQLSNSALQVNGYAVVNSEQEWGLILNRTTAPEFVMKFRGQDIERLSIKSSATSSLFESNSTNGFIFNKKALIQQGSTGSAAAQLHIKGSGTTSATTSLLVQNSAGTDALKVTDDGVVNVYDKFQAFGTFDMLRNGFGISKTTSSLTLSDYTINNRIYTAPTFKSVLYSDAASGGFVGINNTAPTAQLHLKGSGNDATTTALLVQNSDAENIMTITDDGYLTYRTPQRELLTLGNGSVLKYGTNSSFSAL